MPIISKYWAWLVTNWPIDRRDVLALAGFSTLVYGIALVSTPAAWIVSGVLMLTLWAAPWLQVRKKG